MEVLDSSGSGKLSRRDLFAAAGFALVLIAGVMVLLAVWVNPWSWEKQSAETKIFESIAAGKDPSAVVDDFLREGDINAADKEGRTLLMLASSCGEESLVKAVLDRGAEVDRADNQGMTPLMQACKINCSAEVAALLLDRGASYKIRNHFGETPLTLATAYGKNKDVIEVLVTSGADVNAPDAYGWTPLHRAVMEYGKAGAHEAADCLDKIKLLIRLGADVNAVNPVFGHNMRPLDCLYYRGKSGFGEADLGRGKTLVGVLLDRGASVTPPEKCSWTILDNAEVMFGEKKFLDEWNRFLLDCGFRQAERKD